MILLNFNLTDNLLSLGLGVVVSGMIGLITWIFTQNKSETKSRIDARATETDELFEKMEVLSVKVGKLETRMDNNDKHNARLEVTIRDNHVEITKRLDTIFQKILEFRN